MRLKLTLLFSKRQLAPAQVLQADKFLAIKVGSTYL